MRIFKIDRLAVDSYWGVISPSSYWGVKFFPPLEIALFLDFKPVKIFSIALTLPQIMMAEKHDNYGCRIVYSKYTESQCEKIHQDDNLNNHPSCSAINAMHRCVLVSWLIEAFIKTLYLVCAKLQKRRIKFIIILSSQFLVLSLHCWLLSSAIYSFYGRL